VSNETTRFERKFFVSDASFSYVEQVIKSNSAGFLEIYSPRFINNVYFDTFDLKNYFNNIEGLACREKFRVRWYGDMEGKLVSPLLEIKMKNGLLGEKYKYSVLPFETDVTISDQDFGIIFNKSELPLFVRETLKFMTPTLVNRYHRTYFQSANKKFRVTLDRQMEFLDPTLAIKGFSNSFADDENIVLELKYDLLSEVEAAAITNEIPFRLTRNSKYVRGLQITRGGGGFD